MSPLKSIILAAGLVVATSAAALAHDTAIINRTQAGQVNEIELQRRAGQLTRHEYNALVAEQARIAALEQRAQSDGYVTGREYRAIREAQAAAAAHIYQESHDNQVNVWRVWKWNHGYRGH